MPPLRSVTVGFVGESRVKAGRQPTAHATWAEACLRGPRVTRVGSLLLLHRISSPHDFEPLKHSSTP